MAVPYEKNGYTLFMREQPLRRGKTETIYFFSKREPVVGEPIDLPEGYVVAVHPRTGIPFLRKK